jgi:alanyl-tRNA synthetase
MNSNEVRKKFLKFFEKNGHTIVSSSSLIPAEDPTLLFTNAGMNQFKDIFLGKETRGYVRATSMQKCVRAGGKHNDLYQVGFTPRHLTFFEMMGNFSFGDYFKKEAIQFAWDFLTKEMNFNPDDLCVSVFKTDDEAYDLWHKMIGLPKEKLVRLGEEDNFWQMGDTGPCGPCSEIHVDMGERYGCGKKGCAPGCECDRFIEIWNLVFMQYNRQADGTLKPLEKTGVDTGMGFERLCMISQKKDTVFQTDLFETIQKHIEKLTKISYKKSNDETKAAFNVVCDHVRSSCQLIADGCSPANDGRGYVLRKIIRRAALFVQKLSDDKDLFVDIAKAYIKDMSSVYPELKTNEKLILTVLQSEVDRFAVNLMQGQSIFGKYIVELKKENKKVVDGERVFKLYDTYGFPAELTRLIAEEIGFTIDMDGFEKEMKKQQKRSGRKLDQAQEMTFEVPKEVQTRFVGYDEFEIETKVTFVHKDGDAVWVATEESPFYAESGGQVGDKCWMTINNHTYEVKTLKKVGGGSDPAIIAQLVPQKGKEIKVGDTVKCAVDFYMRKNIMKNHTATHLLQAALVQVLGAQVKQAGSLVSDDYLRFDFTHQEALTAGQIEQVEQIVNQKVQDNLEVKTFTTTLEKAKESGVTAFFGEKYNPECVRVVQAVGFSAELCGGTHVKNTGDVGCVKIISEMALATGTRRLTAVSGPKAVELLQKNFDTVKTLCEQFKIKPEQVIDAVQKQTEQYRAALSEIKQLKKLAWKSQVGQWQQDVKKVGSVPFLFLSFEGMGNDDLKQMCLEIEKKSPGFYFLISKNDERTNFLGFVSKTFEKSVDLKKLSATLKDTCNLRGGGKPTLIQGGGVDVTCDIEKVVIDWIK